MWDAEDAQRLGDAIRRLRKARRLSQETLAYTAGITKNQVQLIEAARSSGRSDWSRPSNPHMATLCGLADVFDLSVAELMAEAGL